MSAMFNAYQRASSMAVHLVTLDTLERHAPEFRGATTYRTLALRDLTELANLMGYDLVPRLLPRPDVEAGAAMVSEDRDAAADQSAIGGGRVG